jgi:hypothetical protein
MLDHLLGTDSMQIIHDGASASRVAKTIAIANWPVAHSRLRVCFRGASYNSQRQVFENCGHCEKCLRTMIPLDIVGQRSKFTTFACELSMKNIRRIRYLSASSRAFTLENIRLAIGAKRWDLVAVLVYVVLRGKLLALCIRPLFRLLPANMRSYVKTRVI